MAPIITEGKPFSFEIFGEQPERITAEKIEREVQEAITPEPKKRGRKPGSANKNKEATTEEVPAYVKAMFGPLTVGLHNTICKFMGVSMLDKEQEKLVIDGYAMLLHKRIPDLIEKSGDIIAALGASAYVLGAKLSETKVLDKFFNTGEKQNGKTEQHIDNSRQEGQRENTAL